MELLKWELRKIWRPGILAAILLLGAVYYWMFPQFYIEALLQRSPGRRPSSICLRLGGAVCPTPGTGRAGRTGRADGRGDHGL